MSKIYPFCQEEKYCSTKFEKWTIDNINYLNDKLNSIIVDDEVVKKLSFVEYMSLENTDEFKYDDKFILVEYAKKDILGNEITSTYALKEDLQNEISNRTEQNLLLQSSISTLSDKLDEEIEILGETINKNYDLLEEHINEKQDSLSSSQLSTINNAIVNTDSWTGSKIMISTSTKNKIKTSSYNIENLIQFTKITSGSFTKYTYSNISSYDYVLVEGYKQGVETPNVVSFGFVPSTIKTTSTYQFVCQAMTSDWEYRVLMTLGTESNVQYIYWYTDIDYAGNSNFIVTNIYGLKGVK